MQNPQLKFSKLNYHWSKHRRCSRGIADDDVRGRLRRKRLRLSPQRAIIERLPMPPRYVTTRPHATASFISLLFATGLKHVALQRAEHRVRISIESLLGGDLNTQQARRRLNTGSFKKSERYEDDAEEHEYFHFPQTRGRGGHQHTRQV